MNAYESPTLTRVGTVADLTQGQIFHQGQDSLSWIPIVGPIFGSDPRHPGGGGGGGGFGS
ncbi:MAG: lasso RiPP family leader peptide-containing protein [Nocardioides sp.]|uniref:lasso RiPP family leader peptide-containing protein n=1 Tax=Nocardioides sp. TaxID=35761 RepID=UPI003EFD3D28